jgi:hypothetical protein
VLTEHQRRLIVGVVRATIDGRKDDLRDLMVESGFIADGSPFSADDGHRWFAEILHELLTDQPVTYTEAASARAVNSMIDVRAADHPMRRMSVPPDFVFFSRLNLSMNAILSTLRATFHARAQLDDQDGVAPPVSELGRRHDAWVRARGLPYGMDRHDSH